MNYIFDFDGTLMDTTAVILATIKATIKEMGLPEKTDAECLALIGIRTDEAGTHLYPGSDISNEEFARVFRSNYDRLKGNALEKPYPDVIETLSQLHRDGHKLAIASSRRLASLTDYLQQLGISELFAMVIAGDSVGKGKPDPEPVLTILNALGWEADETLVIGDADVDILMGNRAGCKTCAVTYGNGSIDSLKAAHPTFIINDFAKIPALPLIPQQLGLDSCAD